jgi:hypothetical protein
MHDLASATSTNCELRQKTIGGALKKTFYARNFCLDAKTLGVGPGNTKGESITVPLTSCLTGLD